MIIFPSFANTLRRASHETAGYIIKQSRLILFECQQVMTLLFDNTPHCVPLTADSVNTYNRIPNIQFFNQTGNGCYLTAFIIRSLLTRAQPVFCNPDIDNI
ncbi:hypothetical protein Barb6XT_02082 [Bacteroidales bacterium Barb6XT]|nr:hypothetical protein Barb6XT_02082 [Bacteroidales bacterium Barb6XT]